MSRLEKICCKLWSWHEWASATGFVALIALIVLTVVSYLYEWTRLSKSLTIFPLLFVVMTIWGEMGRRMEAREVDME